MRSRSGRPDGAPSSPSFGRRWRPRRRPFLSLLRPPVEAPTAPLPLPPPAGVEAPTPAWRPRRQRRIRRKVWSPLSSLSDQWWILSLSHSHPCRSPMTVASSGDGCSSAHGGEQRHGPSGADPRRGGANPPRRHGSTEGRPQPAATARIHGGAAPTRRDVADPRRGVVSLPPNRRRRRSGGRGAHPGPSSPSSGAAG